MKKPEITKRDIKFFFFGALVMFFAEMIYKWIGAKNYNETNIGKRK